jgi:hypothetical protein
LHDTELLINTKNAIEHIIQSPTLATTQEISLALTNIITHSQALHKAILHSVVSSKAGAAIWVLARKSTQYIQESKKEITQAWQEHTLAGYDPSTLLP